MIARSWIESREAIGGVILKGARLDVARFLTAPHTVPVVLAYSHFLEVAAAIRNEQGAVVGIPGAAKGDAQAALRELHLKGVTHLAVERDSDVANELTRAVPRGFRLLCETPEVQIFEVLPLSGVNR